MDCRQIDAALPHTLRELIAPCAAQPGLPARVAERSAAARDTPLGAFALAPCVPDPGKIVCLGVNYVDHANEGGKAIADDPAFFLCCNTSLLRASVHIATTSAAP